MAMLEIDGEKLANLKVKLEASVGILEMGEKTGQLASETQSFCRYVGDRWGKTG